MPTTQPNLNLESLYRPLWLTYGLVPLLAGLDKFFNLLTDWPKYLAPWMANLLTMGLFDIAVRDLAMSVGAYTLARLAELRQEGAAAVPAASLREHRV